LRLGGEEFGTEEEGEATLVEEPVEFSSTSFAGKRRGRFGLETAWSQGGGYGVVLDLALKSVDSVLEREALTDQGVRCRRQGI
jgi:hypothetical protein